MKPLADWSDLTKPGEAAYNRLVEAILDGSLPPNSTLPSEVQLSESLKVTRSTLREALQRLEANGMVEIRHGKPTRVRDIWVEGNMNTLASVVNHQYQAMSSRWVPQMLEVRQPLAAAYARAAVQRQAEKVAAMLTALTGDLPEEASVFARVDWEVHHQLTLLSQNPIFTLILNGFQAYYQMMAESYFSYVETRQHSRKFYRDLHQAARQGDSDLAGQLTSQVMEESLQFWLKLNQVA